MLLFTGRCYGAALIHYPRKVWFMTISHVLGPGGMEGDGGTVLLCWLSTSKERKVVCEDSVIVAWTKQLSGRKYDDNMVLCTHISCGKPMKVMCCDSSSPINQTQAFKHRPELSKLRTILGRSAMTCLRTLQGNVMMFWD